MQHVALLMFHRNEPSGVVRTIQAIGSSFAERLVVDSSDSARYRELLEGLADRGAQVVRAPALGCTEPLRPFAHSLLRSPWVLSVDADEEVEPGLVAAVQGELGDASGFRVRREEPSLATQTWPLRLYRPDRTRYAGWIHEDPEVVGPTERLPAGAGLVHRADYSRYLAKPGRGQAYLVAESFERPFTGRSLRREFPGRWLAEILPDSDEPLSPARSWLFLLAWHGGRWLPGSSPLHRRRQRRYFGAYLRARRAAFLELAPSERQEAAKIAEALRAAGGPIPYLGFNDPAAVAGLASPDGAGDGGTLLRSLLQHRYRRGVAARSLAELTRPSLLPGGPVLAGAAGQGG